MLFEGGCIFHNFEFSLTSDALPRNDFGSCSQPAACLCKSSHNNGPVGLVGQDGPNGQMCQFLASCAGLGRLATLGLVEKVGKSGIMGSFGADPLE